MGHLGKWLDNICTRIKMILDNKEFIFISPFPNKGLKKKALLWNQKFCLKEKK